MVNFDPNIIIDICRKNDISKVGIFGSTVRGEATESSDIDILVNLSKPKSLLAIIRIERVSKDIRKLYPEIPWQDISWKNDLNCFRMSFNV